MPIPRDIPLPVPGDEVWLKALLVALFLAHIVFVNLMVGGSLMTTVCEIIGRKRPAFDGLARAIAGTITVNKSLAVVLGVGPLLLINVLYTVYFYSANALTGNAWVSVIPLVIAAFLIGYLHKYSWDRMASAKGWHIALGAAGTVLFLAIPLVFLTNINLMLFPQRWPQVAGFLSAAALPNVLPRYLHFLLASIAVTALFLIGYLTRNAFPLETAVPGIDRRPLRRGLFAVALGATIGQLFAGPLVLFTLPKQGLGLQLYAVVGIGATLAVIAILLLSREVAATRPQVGRTYVPVAVLLTWTVCFMAYGRHVYREGAVAEHRTAMEAKTAAFEAAVTAGVAEKSAASDERPVGQRIFEGTCAGCHAVDHVLVGPPIREIAELYKGNPDGIAKWAKNPGRRRPDFPVMPAFQFNDDDMRAVAEYMLQLANQSTTKPG